MKLSKKAFGVTAGALVLVLTSLTLASATSTSGPVYHACANANNVLSTRVANKGCPAGTHAVTINAKGNPGPMGQTGAAGPVSTVPGPAGAPGAPGAPGRNGTNGTSPAYYSQTIATPGADPADANTVTLATVGPFTVTGSCYQDGSDNVYAETDVTTSADGSAINDYMSGTNDYNWQSGTSYQIGDVAEGSTTSPALDSEDGTDGYTTMVSTDSTTTVNLFSNDAVYIGVLSDPDAPACTFYGSYAANAS